MDRLKDDRVLSVEKKQKSGLKFFIKARDEPLP